MPSIVFFDNDPELRLPADLVFALDNSDLHEQVGECKVSIVSDRSKLTSLLRGRSRPDVLFIDLHWQDTWRDGLPLLTRARQLEPSMPIFVLTSEKRDAPTVQECFEAGASSFWNKDDSLTNLVQLVEDALLRIRPTLQRAERLRRNTDVDARAWETSRWIEESVSQIATDTLREAAGWLREALASNTASSERETPLRVILNGLDRIGTDLRNRAQREPQDIEILADAHFHAGEWRKAEDEYKSLIECGVPVWRRLIRLAELLGDYEARDRYRLGQAVAHSKNGRHAEAAELYAEIATAGEAHDDEFYLGWIGNARAAGRDVVAVVREWLRNRYAAVGADAAALVQQHILLARERRAITPDELGAALADLASEDDMFIRAPFDVLQTLYYYYDGSDPEGVVAGILGRIDIDRISDAGRLIDIAEIASASKKTDLFRRSVTLAWFLSHSSAETEAVLQRAIRLSESSNDAATGREMTRRLWEYWSLVGTSKESELAAAAQDWIGRHPIDFEMRELASDLLITTTASRNDGVRIMAQLVAEPGLQNEDDIVRRLLRKLALLDDDEAREIYRSVTEAWKNTGKTLVVESVGKPLRGRTIVLFGGGLLETMRAQVTAFLTRNGAQAVWRTSLATRKTTDLIPANADFVIVHLGMGHSDWRKVCEALTKGSVPRAEIPNNQGLVAVKRAIERQFGALP